MFLLLGVRVVVFFEVVVREFGFFQVLFGLVIGYKWFIYGFSLLGCLFFLKGLDFRVKGLEFRV